MELDPRRCAIALLVLAAIVLSIVGCGGGSGTTAPTASATPAKTGVVQAGSKSQFITQADAVCGRTNAEIRAVKAKSGSAAEVIRVVPRTLAIEQKGTAALEKLAPPASLARDWRRMLGYRRTLAIELTKLLEAARQNSGASVKPLAASKKRVHASLSKTATTNGFKDCAKVGAAG
jgi:hypothetical protein